MNIVERDISFNQSKVLNRNSIRASDHPSKSHSLASLNYLKEPFEPTPLKTPGSVSKATVSRRLSST